VLSFHTPFVGLFKVGTGLAAILFPSVCNAVALNVTPGGIEWQSNKSGRVDLFWTQWRANVGKLTFFVSYLLSLFSAIFRISKTGDETYIFPDTSQVFRLGHIPFLRPIASAEAALPRHD
jgi:fumarate reductase subunit D